MKTLRGMIQIKQHLGDDMDTRLLEDEVNRLEIFQFLNEAIIAIGETKPGEEGPTLQALNARIVRHLRDTNQLPSGFYHFDSTLGWVKTWPS